MFNLNILYSPLIKNTTHSKIKYKAVYTEAANKAIINLPFSNS